jgi:hypothetical protein
MRVEKAGRDYLRCDAYSQGKARGDNLPPTDMLANELTKELDDAPNFLYVGGDSCIKEPYSLLRVVKLLNRILTLSSYSRVVIAQKVFNYLRPRRESRWLGDTGGG